ncbi:Uncharacterised protein [Mycobacteroides abscessus subsp. abscessus]|nr:Uncharacterised protein [Mycobacteroides abscessus subsp. abscessus]
MTTSNGSLCVTDAVLTTDSREMLFSPLYELRYVLAGATQASAASRADRAASTSLGSKVSGCFGHDAASTNTSSRAGASLRPFTSGSPHPMADNVFRPRTIFGC